MGGTHDDYGYDLPEVVGRGRVSFWPNCDAGHSQSPGLDTQQKYSDPVRLSGI